MGAVCVTGAVIAGIYLSMPGEEAPPDFGDGPIPAPAVIEPSVAPPASDQPASEPPAPAVDGDPIPDYIRDYAALWEDYEIRHERFFLSVRDAYIKDEIRFTEHESYTEADIPVLVEIAVYELHKGNRPLVDRYVDILTGIAPDDADVQALLALVASSDADIVTAASHAENAIRADPDGLYPNIVKFEALFVDENFEEAIPYGEYALSLGYIDQSRQTSKLIDLIPYLMEN
ncbi:MAG: hypothetical protein MPK30_09605 [Gammaproteobacteria bacterium]|nr:hypothetical protein [Gammaproteobacteria bacterium]